MTRPLPLLNIHQIYLMNKTRHCFTPPHISSYVLAILSPTHGHKVCRILRCPAIAHVHASALPPLYMWSSARDHVYVYQSF